uniref:Uncharacterized protein n=1 Tax=Romanomermis culicivorax TaxID=13658 RepID=A0A915IAW0_ROMCU
MEKVQTDFEFFRRVDHLDDAVVMLQRPVPFVAGSDLNSFSGNGHSGRFDKVNKVNSKNETVKEEMGSNIVISINVIKKSSRLYGQIPPDSIKSSSRKKTFDVKCLRNEKVKILKSRQHHEFNSHGFGVQIRIGIVHSFCRRYGDFRRPAGERADQTNRRFALIDVKRRGFVGRKIKGIRVVYCWIFRIRRTFVENNFHNT